MHRKIACSALLLCLLTTPLLAEMSVDDVVAKFVEARGGNDALKATTTVRMTGKMNMGGGMEAPFVAEYKRPNKLRVEFTMQGMTGTQAYDGSNGWFVMPFMGKKEPEKMSDDLLTMIKEQADFDGPIIDAKEKGNTVELVGKEEVDGTEAYKLKVTRADGKVIYSFLDAEQFLEFKSETKFKNPNVGEVGLTTIYGDYKEVGGLLLPHSIEQVFEGAPAGQVITIEKVELNVDLPDDRFAMPTPAAAPAGN